MSLSVLVNKCSLRAITPDVEFDIDIDRVYGRLQPLSICIIIRDYRYQKVILSIPKYDIDTRTVSDKRRILDGKARLILSIVRQN